MTDHRVSRLAEYTLLVGSGAGAIASFTAQNALYASAPLTLLVALGLLNRKHLEHQLAQAESTLSQRTDQLNRSLGRLSQQVSALPSPEAVTSFQRSIADRTDRAFVRFSQELEQLQQDTQKQLSARPQPNLSPLHQDITQLQEQHSQTQHAVESLVSQVQRLSAQPRLGEAEAQIAQLKTELMQLRVNLEVLTQENHAATNQVQDSLDHLERQLRQLPFGFDPNLMRDEVKHLTKTVTELVPRRDFSHLASRLQEIHQRQIDLQRALEAVKPLIVLPEPLEAARTAAMPSPAPEAAGPHWSVEFPRAGAASASRQLLEATLKQVQERLLLVWPWDEDWELDQELVRQFYKLLAKGCQLEIGWCHQGNAQQGRFLRAITRRWRSNSDALQGLRSTLKQLQPLRQAFPRQFHFKVLGSDESFLVCDRTFAVLHLEALPARSSVFPRLQPRLRVQDTAIIDALARRFDAPESMPRDATAFFNRAVTRYDLRDTTGAIADFTQVLTLNPSHAVAYNNRGVAYGDLNRSADAEADFTQAIGCGDHPFAAHCNRGWLRLDQGRYPAAMDDFTYAISLDSQSPLPYVYRGSAYQQLGDINRAIADYNRAIAQSPTALPYIYRSTVHQQRGDLRRAIADLELAQQRLATSSERVTIRSVERALERLRQNVRGIG